MAADTTFFDVLEADLRALCAESYRPDNLATQITGWLSHTDYPQLKEASERAAMKLRTIPQDKAGVAAVRSSKEILRPFLLVLEFRNPRLVGHSLAAIQRMLANNAVSVEGRRGIIQALQQVEKVNDDMVKLKTMQTALTLLQSAGAVDSQEDVGMILSVCFRAYGQSRSSPTVSSTAAATIRQAVAIVFDHAASTGPGAATEAEAAPPPAAAAAAGLLQDVCNMSSGKPPVWLRCPILPRLFLLELLESVLLHRAPAFQANPVLTQLLNDEVCPQLQQLASRALDPEVEPAGSSEARLILRCATAVLRKHIDAVQSAAPALLNLLIEGCNEAKMTWQRLLALQGLRVVFSEPLLLQKVFRSFDASMDHGNPMQDAVSTLKNNVQGALDRPDREDLLEALNGLFVTRASGKETPPDVDAVGPQQAALLDTWVLYLSVDILLLLVSNAETLADMVPAHQRASAELRDAAVEQPEAVVEDAAIEASNGAQFEVIANMCDVLWRFLLSGLQPVLKAAKQESLVLALLKGYQSYIFSCNTLGKNVARDGFLMDLCKVACGGVDADSPQESVSDGGAPASVTSTLTASLNRGNTISSVTSDVPSTATSLAAAAAAAAGAGSGAAAPAPKKMGNKGIHALRTLFNVAHRLADSLGTSWIHVVQVLNTLEAVLASGKDPSTDSSEGGALPSDLFILATAANQLFQCSYCMSTDALVSLLGALTHVSIGQLPQLQAAASGGAAGGGGGGGSTVGSTTRLAALTRVVEVMLANPDRLQDLWGIFLTHIVDLLHSGTAQARAAAIDALDRTITGTLSTQASSVSSSSSAPSLSSPTTAAGRRSLSGRGSLDRTTSWAAGRSSKAGQPSLAPETAAAVENMMLVALESMYKEEREPDVRQGLLRVVQHVLQRNGDHMTRGWVPVLRLLEAVPSWEDSATINLGFQCVELVCGDFFITMPKEHLERTLEALHLFASQRTVINISLAAIGSLWNVTDTISRSRPAPASIPATPSSARASAVGGLLSGITAAVASVAGISSTSSTDEDGSISTGGGAAAKAGPSRAQSPAGGAAGAGRHDLSDLECTQLLLEVFQHLRQLSADVRPEVRNSGVRTLLLAIGSQAQRFDPATWRHCLWSILFPLLSFVHDKGDTSSSQEAERVELGKENGRSVHLLTHHSRNSEQKQWDETTVLALNGLGKVLRSNLASILAMAGFTDKWDELMTICTKALTSGRKAVAVAAAQLVTGVLQVIKRGEQPEANFAWKRCMSTLDTAIAVMARPACPVPLQARSELLTGLATAYAAQKQGGFDLEDTEALLRWCGGLARYPLGVDDVTPVPGVLPPVQKLVLQLLGHLSPVVQPAAWPSVLGTLSGFLCPLQALLQQQRQQQQQQSSEFELSEAPSTPAGRPSSSASPFGTPKGTPLSGTSSFLGAFGSVQHQKSSSSSTLSFFLPSAKAYSPSRAAPAADRSRSGQLPQEVGLLTPLFMGRIVTLLVTLWKNFAPYQHRAAKFSQVVASLTECMALRHVAPHEDLWVSAAAAFCEVTAAGLPAVNICFVNHQSAPADTWEVLASAFECFLFGDHIPEELLPQPLEEVPAAGGPSSSSNLGNGTNGQDADATSAEADASSREGWATVDSSSTTAEAQQQQQQPQGAQQRKRPSRNQPPDPSSGPAAAQGDKLAALQAQVLETLTDNVLTACASAPHAARWRLVAVVARGAELPPSWPLGLPTQQQQQRQQATSNGSAEAQCRQMCMQKLFQLCARGNEGHGSNKCHLEVAQLTVVPLVDRCATALRLYGAQVAQQPDLPSSHAATEDVLVMLEALLGLQLDHAVLDALAAHYPMHPAVAGLVQGAGGSAGLVRRSSSGAAASAASLLVRQLSPATSGGSGSGHLVVPPSPQARGQPAAQGLQTHLVVLYEPLVQCLVAGDLRVRHLLQQLLLAVGKELQLLSAR